MEACWSMCRYQRWCTPDTHSLCWREVQSCSEVLYLSFSTTFLFLFPFPSTCLSHKHTHHSAFMLTLCTFAALFLKLSISIRHGSSVFRRSEALLLSDTSQLSAFVPAISKLSEETLFRCCWELSLCVCLRNQGPVRNSASKKVTSKILPLS